MVLSVPRIGLRVRRAKSRAKNVPNVALAREQALARRQALAPEQV
jgi:hypothetical protein